MELLLLVVLGLLLYRYRLQFIRDRLKMAEVLAETVLELAQVRRHLGDVSSYSRLLRQHTYMLKRERDGYAEKLTELKARQLQ